MISSRVTSATMQFHRPAEQPRICPPMIRIRKVREESAGCAIYAELLLALVSEKDRKMSIEVVWVIGTYCWNNTAYTMFVTSYGGLNNAT